ncbi:MAG: class I SAM-dependent methyltransferase [Reinekea sp.]|jgi:16S rRNA (guanine1207-N2)-methyltransferase
MQPTLQLLERLQAEFNDIPVHWFDGPDNNPLQKSSDKTYALNWQQNNQALPDQTIWPTNQLNILFYPKAKERLHWWLNQLSSSLQPDQHLWIVGHNDGGIKSLPKRIKDDFECVKIDSARHCTAYELIPRNTLPTGENWQHFEFHDITAYALPGVFSAGKLDKGTEVLLTVLPQLKGHILEFGAGCGILTSIIASQDKVEKVDAVEIDLLAVRSSQRTIRENQLSDRIQLHWSAGTEDLAENRFNAIVTNPPFHQGIRTAYEPTQLFFSQAHQWLKPGGKLLWVANDFLNYQDLLVEHFHHIELLTHTRGFRVYQAIRKYHD